MWLEMWLSYVRGHCSPSGHHQVRTPNGANLMMMSVYLSLSRLAWRWTNWFSIAMIHPGSFCPKALNLSPDQTASLVGRTHASQVRGKYWVALS